MRHLQWLLPQCILAVTSVASHSTGRQSQQPLGPESLHHDNQFPALQQTPASPPLLTNNIDLDDPTHAPLFALHRDLVNINSISGQEHAIGLYLESYLQRLNYTVERQPVAPVNLTSSTPHSTSTYCSSPPPPLPRFNLLAHPSSHRHTPIILTTHIDTVPPFYPYSTDPATRLRGRGSVDAKACIAAQLFAACSLHARSLVPTGSLSHLFVVGEEIGGDGMRRANALALRPQAVIFGEPTDLRLASGHKGILIFRLRARGMAAHSGYPWLGASATDLLVRTLAALQTVAWPSSEKYGNSTLNIGTVEGGVAANVVAEYAMADVGLRLAGGEVEAVKRLVRETVAAAAAAAADTDYDDTNDTDDANDTDATNDDNNTTTTTNAPLKATLKIDFYGGAYPPIDIDHDIPGFDDDDDNNKTTTSATTVNFGTDIPNLHGSYKRYLYGPGSIQVAHTEHEAVEKRDLLEAVRGYERIVLHALEGLS